jgi:hypothetical protein
MSNVQTGSRGVREHVKHIFLFFPLGSLRSLEDLIFVPEVLPFFLNFFERISVI